MRVDGKLGGFAAGVWRRGRRCAFAGGSVWTSLGHLVGLTPVRNKSETQCYHDLRRPGSAVRMFMRPFVWTKCAPHIHVNVLPGCFQISRANPKRLQLLKRFFVLETHWPRLFRSGVRQKGQLWRTWSAGLFTWSRARGDCPCHERPPRQSRSPVCHERPTRQSRSPACHERPPR